MTVEVHKDCRLHATPDGLPPGSVTAKHPGHWELHHVGLPDDRAGDFMPCSPADYAEDRQTVLDQLLEHIGWVAFGTDAGPEPQWEPC